MGDSRQTTLFLLRHTETVWNIEGRYQGVVDAPLSEPGKREIERIVDAVPPGSFDRIFTSPLSRARLLAERIAGVVEAPLTIDQRLLEIHLGPWQGLTHSEIEQRFPDMLRDWKDSPDRVRFPGGENLEEVALRITAFIEERFADRDCPRVLAVSHDSVIKVGLMLSLGLDLGRLHAFRLRNGSVSVLRGSTPDGAVESMDVTSHLTGSPFLVEGRPEIGRPDAVDVAREPVGRSIPPVES